MAANRISYRDPEEVHAVATIDDAHDSNGNNTSSYAADAASRDRQASDASDVSPAATITRRTLHASHKYGEHHEGLLQAADPGADDGMDERPLGNAPPNTQPQAKLSYERQDSLSKLKLQYRRGSTGSSLDGRLGGIVNTNFFSAGSNLGGLGGGNLSKIDPNTGKRAVITTMTDAGDLLGDSSDTGSGFGRRAMIRGISTGADSTDEDTLGPLPNASPSQTTSVGGKRRLRGGGGDRAKAAAGRTSHRKGKASMKMPHYASDEDGSLRSRRANTIGGMGTLLDDGTVDEESAICSFSAMVDMASTLLLLILLAIVQFFVKPFERVFFIDDPSIRYPHVGASTVPVGLLYGASLGVPIISFCIVSALRYHEYAQPIRRLFYRIFGLVQVLTLVTVLTVILKNTAGKLRPDFLDRCLPRNGVCTNADSELIDDGRRAFPSGHASVAWAGLGYLSLYLIYELDLFKDLTPLVPSSRVLRLKRYAQHQQFIFTRLLIAALPFVLAVLVSVSRIIDNRHHASDVVGGGLLGFSIAVAVFWVHHRQVYGQGHEDKVRRAANLEEMKASMKVRAT